MMWIATAALLLAGYWLWTLSRKSLPFWKLVANHPEEAWSFVVANPHFHFEKTKGQDVVGPFTIFRPDGQAVTVYIDADHIDAVQREFVQIVSK